MEFVKKITHASLWQVFYLCTYFVSQKYWLEAVGSFLPTAVKRSRMCWLGSENLGAASFALIFLNLLLCSILNCWKNCQALVAASIACSFHSNQAACFQAGRKSLLSERTLRRGGWHCFDFPQFCSLLTKYPMCIGCSSQAGSFSPDWSASDSFGSGWVGAPDRAFGTILIICVLCFLVLQTLKSPRWWKSIWLTRWIVKHKNWFCALFLNIAYT